MPLGYSEKPQGPMSFLLHNQPCAHWYPQVGLWDGAVHRSSQLLSWSCFWAHEGFSAGGAGACPHAAVCRYRISVNLGVECDLLLGGHFPWPMGNLRTSASAELSATGTLPSLPDPLRYHTVAWDTGCPGHLESFCFTSMTACWSCPAMSQSTQAGFYQFYLQHELEKSHCS